MRKGNVYNRVMPNRARKDEKSMKQTKRLPLIPLRGLVVFPYMVLHFDVGRPKSVNALEKAMAEDQLVFLTLQEEEQIEEPVFTDLAKMGTIAKVKQVVKNDEDNVVRVLVEGISRASLEKIEETQGCVFAEVIEFLPQSAEFDEVEYRAMSRNLVRAFEEHFKLAGKIQPETVLSVAGIGDPGQMTDVIAANMQVSPSDKQTILECVDVRERLECLLVILHKELEVAQLDHKIREKVKEQLDQNQREYYLREQMKVIEEELGDDNFAEVQEYEKKIKALQFAPEEHEKLMQEVRRLKKMPSMTPEAGVIKNYLDLVLSLPWQNESEENTDLKRAEAILEEDHYGLKEVKERILEHLAVRVLAGKVKGSVLCLVGPPGVGKTSVARSVARALGRKYVRVSLGGVRDEAEIRGHRKTYIGAMPGRIINAVKQAGTKNPLILLDEIDKMSGDFRGDPAAALLEVLDTEQNFQFKDHYTELPFDLSDVMFLMTANTLETVPRPLLDRMEIIELTGYTETEKLQIATQYLIPKSMESCGIKKSEMKVEPDAVEEIIEYYTREAGVRELERKLRTLCRKSAKLFVLGKQKSIKVSRNTVEKLLGKHQYEREVQETDGVAGVICGLAWTAVGGDTLSIEVNVMDGSGKVELTGQLGDVMKESALAAISYIRSKAKELHIDSAFYQTKDIHIHVPEGATPKDGPSAGITIATALISALRNCPPLRGIAMTGEITIRGRVLPIGGLKEKSMAAYKAGKTTVIIPKANEKDLAELAEPVKQQIHFIPVETMDEVIAAVFGQSFGQPRKKEQKSRKEVPMISTVPGQGAVMMDEI